MSDLLATDRLPRTIRVGSYTYSLEFVETSHEDLGEDNYGITHTDVGRILIDKNCAFERLVNTLFHEINHAINASYGIDDGVEEETVATQNANGWMQVNRDNPKLELWFHRAWRELRKYRD